jgi:cellulose biosynthesis protein BcsQ
MPPGAASLPGSSPNLVHEVSMAYFIAVANRKGGVGKSTIAVMLAHGLATWSSKRVLVIDLDSQCNTSLILLGGEGWLQSKKAGINIADFFFDHYDGNMPKPKDFLLHNVGDVRLPNGKAPVISLLPGSLLLEDVQGELYLREARQSKDPDIVSNHVRTKIDRLLRSFSSSFDVIIFDCAPGLSFAALAALKIADRVLVPFKPDYVSMLAVDRIAQLIEGRRSDAAVREIPPQERRYATLANCANEAGRDRIVVENIAADHPMFETRVRQRESIREAFEFDESPKTIDQKYADGVEDVRQLCAEVDRRWLRS